jgi:iron-sulfur cluster repair protein YtfE (RIC family)
VALAIRGSATGADDHLGGESVAWPVRPSGPDPAALIRSEHRELISGVADLGRLAQRLSGGDVDQLAGEIQTAIEFLKHELLPHAQAEERLIYPKVERVLRAEGGATGTMEYDHRRIERLARDLDGVATAGHSNEARLLLQQLATTVQLHFDKEEELYLPLLSRLGPEEREAMVRSLTGAHPEEPMPQKGVGKDDGERGDE